MVEVKAERGVSPNQRSIVRQEDHYASEFECRWNRLAGPAHRSADSVIKQTPLSPTAIPI